MKRLKRLFLIFSFILTIVISTSVSAEKTTYKAGILNDYSFSGNDISQYSKDCTQSVIRLIDNSSVVFSEENLDSAVKDLNEGQLDFLCMVPRSSSLESYIDYCSEPVATGFLGLFTHFENSLYFNDFNNFNGIKIGLLKNSYFEDYLKAYSTENHFSYESVYFDTADELISAVYNGNIDAVFTPITQKPDGLRIISKCGEFRYFLAVKKGNRIMLDTLNSALSLLKQQNPFFLSDSFVKSFRIPYANTSAMTDDDYRSAQRQEVLRVLVPTDNYPLAYYDSQTGEYTGLYVEILKQIASNTGLEIKYIPDDQPDMTMSSIEAGTSDVILTVSGSTDGLIRATEPYTHISYLPVTRFNTDISAEDNLTIGILESDKWITDYLKDIYPQWTIQEYSSVHSLLHAAEKNKVSASILSTPDMQTKTSLIAHPKLSISDSFSVNVPVSLGISRLTCHYTVVNLLNKTIAGISIPQEEFENKVYTLSHTYVPNFFDMLYANKLWLILALLVFAVVIVIVKLRERHFRQLALTDSLTSIPNKMYFFENVNKILEKSPNRPYLLCTLDAKNFKLVNDRFGRIIGDQTLRDIALRIKDIFKDNAIYARAQSDSFLIFAEDTPENRNRIDSIENLNIYIHNSSNYHLLLKTGVCPIERYDAQLGIDNYIDRAVIAKAHSPARNENSVTYFTKDMEAELNLKNTIEVEMDKALEKGEFIVYYQPKYELLSDKIIGAEALVRWSREGSLISPAVFIPLFEKNGFIVELDFYVYEQVMKMIKSRIQGEDKIVPISMNVSRCHLSDEHFVEKLEELVEKYGVPKEYVEIEITESIFDREDSTAVELIKDLKSHGFAISMDDFGSGYSSLNLLRELPIDTLKIDKVFIDNADTSPRGRAIIEAIISMAAQINIKTICEGVETSGQRDFLKQVGCNMVQGFFYAKPLTFNDFEKLLNSSE